MRDLDSGPARPGDGFERIAPADLNSTPVGAGPLPSRNGISTRGLLIAAGLILLLAGMLLIGLPALLDASGPVAPATGAVDAMATGTPASSAPPPATAGAGPAAPAAAVAGAAPIWDDEALLRARAESQTLATQLGPQLDALRAAAAPRWAAAAFAAAEAEVGAARAAFDARDFRNALERYRAASSAVAALDAERPRQLKAAIANGYAALASGALEPAAEAFDLALAISPGDAEARRGQTRVSRFPAVQVQLQNAASAEARGDLAAAASAWREALKLDPDTDAARSGLARLDAAAASARFGKSMAAALAALDGGQLDGAEQALQAAASQRPGDAGVADARARLARARREQQLAALETQAAAATRAESWADAVRHHEAALAIDPSLATAQAGLAAARPRAALAARLEAWIAQPARLASEAVQADARQGLASARAVAVPGPVLQQQIATLDRLLRDATTPVVVRLQSDERTDVTVYKVGPQGRFKDKQLQLRPGRYTAVGARPGYVDVRVEFDVAPDGAASPVQIRCEEKL